MNYMRERATKIDELLRNVTEIWKMSLGSCEFHNSIESCKRKSEVNSEKELNLASSTILFTDLH